MVILYGYKEFLNSWNIPHTSISTYKNHQRKITQQSI